MDSPDEGKKEPNKTEQGQEAGCCGSECGCHKTGASNRTRWIVSAIVLVAAVAMVARAVVKSNSTPSQASGQSFALPVAGTNISKAAGIPETNLGTTIDAFAELSSLAENNDAVFIYLPGKEGATNVPSEPVKAAARTIDSQGIKCGLFTLKADSADYKEVSAQVSVPGVLVMVKGRGMSPVSGEITETKLIQGFVAATRSGGCGASCAPGSCGPK